MVVAEIRGQQLEAALRLKPDLVSVVAGANDIMTAQFSATRWEEEFLTLYQAFTQTGAVAIAATLPGFPNRNTLTPFVIPLIAHHALQPIK